MAFDDERRRARAGASRRVGADPLAAGGAAGEFLRPAARHRAFGLGQADPQGPRRGVRPTGALCLTPHSDRALRSADKQHPNAAFRAFPGLRRPRTPTSATPPIPNAEFLGRIAIFAVELSVRRW